LPKYETKAGAAATTTTTRRCCVNCSGQRAGSDAGRGSGGGSSAHNSLTLLSWQQHLGKVNEQHCLVGQKQSSHDQSGMERVCEGDGAWERARGEQLQRNKFKKVPVITW